MPANLENLAVATELEKVSFHSIPKESQCQRMFKLLHSLISHASQVMLKFSKPGFSNTSTVNFQMFKLVLEKAEEPEIKLPTSAGSSKKQESSRKTSISALLTMLNKTFDCVDHKKLGKILQEIGIPDHLICLLRSLYAGQEATVRT